VRQISGLSGPATRSGWQVRGGDSEGNAAPGTRCRRDGASTTGQTRGAILNQAAVDMDAGGAVVNEACRPRKEAERNCSTCSTASGELRESRHRFLSKAVPGGTRQRPLRAAVAGHDSRTRTFLAGKALDAGHGWADPVSGEESRGDHAKIYSASPEARKAEGEGSPRMTEGAPFQFGRCE